MNAFLKHLEVDDNFLVNGYIRRILTISSQNKKASKLLLAQIKSYTEGYGGEYVNKRKFLEENNLTELEFIQLARKLNFKLKSLSDESGVCDSEISLVLKCEKFLNSREFS